MTSIRILFRYLNKEFGQTAEHLSVYGGYATWLPAGRRRQGIEPVKGLQGCREDIETNNFYRPAIKVQDSPLLRSILNH